MIKHLPGNSHILSLCTDTGIARLGHSFFEDAVSMEIWILLFPRIINRDAK